MNVLIVSTDFPPYSSGGGGQNRMLLDAESLAASGAKVTVVCGRAKRPSISLAKGIEVIRVYFPDIPPHSLWFQVANRAFILKLAKKADVVYAYAWSCSLLAKSIRAMGIPFLVRLAGLPKLNVTNLFKAGLSNTTISEVIFFFGLGPVYSYLLSRDIYDSTHILLDSRHIGEALERVYHCSVQSKSTVIEHAYTSHETGCDRIEDTKKTIVFVGRLVSTKGVLDLLRAFSILKERFGYSECRLVLIGEGPMRQRLRKESIRLGCSDSVFLLGRLELDGVENTLRRSKVFVLPSYNESASVALSEAMSFGLPVVVPRLPWAIEQTLGYEPKCYFTIGDVQDLAGCLLKMLSLPLVIRPNIKHQINDVAKMNIVKLLEILAQQKKSLA